MENEQYQARIPLMKDGGHATPDSGVSYGSLELEEALSRKILEMIGLLEWYDSAIAERAEKQEKLLAEGSTIDLN